MDVQLDFWTCPECMGERWVGVYDPDDWLTGLKPCPTCQGPPDHT